MAALVAGMAGEILAEESLTRDASSGVWMGFARTNGQQHLRIATEPGAWYGLLTSPDLSHWTTQGWYFGVGQTMSLPLFTLPETLATGTANTNVPPDFISAMVMVMGARQGGSVASWTAFENDGVVRHLLPAVTLPPGNVPAIHHSDSNHSVSVLAFPGAMETLPANASAVTGRDATLAGLLESSLTNWIDTWQTQQQVRQGNPEPAPVPGPRGFQRVEVWLGIDTDNDGYTDAEELQQGTSCFDGGSFPGHVGGSGSPNAGNDADGDGVPNRYDEFPGDANRATVRPVQYAVIDLGTNAPPVRVTTNGWVLLGPAEADGTNVAGYRWQGGILERIPKINQLILNGINSSGTLVGTEVYDNRDQYPYDYHLGYHNVHFETAITIDAAGGRTRLDSLPVDAYRANWEEQLTPLTHSWSEGHAISDSGIVYGTAYVDSQTEIDYYPGDANIPLPPLWRGETSVTWDGVRWEEGSWTQLGTMFIHELYWHAGEERVVVDVRGDRALHRGDDWLLDGGWIRGQDYYLDGNSLGLPDGYAPQHVSSGGDLVGFNNGRTFLRRADGTLRTLTNMVCYRGRADSNGVRHTTAVNVNVGPANSRAEILSGYLWTTNVALHGITNAPAEAYQPIWLDELVPRQWHIETATDLADNGLLVGTASTNGGTPNAVLLLPIEIAPDVLRVNADFDEQKLDTATTFAKADCDDEDLKAAIGPDAGKVIIFDLHKGFFGVNPNTLPADFYTGATVTIEKLPEDDPETSQPELGEVRFYATKNQGGNGEQFWPIPITEPASGGGTAPKNLVPVIYAENATVPRGTDVKFWIEGVKAGPITLEFKYVKGSLTFSHKQKFLVATHQSKAEWQKEIIEQIKLQTSGAVDFTSYHPPWPAVPFMTNKAYIQNVYAYYEYIYLQKPDQFMWPGLAKMAGGPVYGAMVDAEHYRGPVPPWWDPAQILAAAARNAVSDYFQTTLMKGNYDIFDDLAWQFRAYQASGIWALRHIDVKGLGGPAIRPFEIGPWNQMWQGEYSPSVSLVQAANYALTRREQEFIVQPAWTIFSNGFIGLEYLLGVLAESPLPGGEDFTTVVGLTRDITLFSDRWTWLDSPGNGIWADWTGLSTAGRTGLVTIPLQTRAQSYSIFYISSAGLFPIIW